MLGKKWLWSIGNNTQINSNIPVQVEGLTENVVSISLGNMHSCGLLTQGRVKCFGNNHFGQLGARIHGRSSLTPVSVEGF